MAGLEPEFQPVVNYLLPNILSHKQDPHDIHLQVNYIILCHQHANYAVYLFYYYSILSGVSLFTVVARHDKSVACISSTTRGKPQAFLTFMTLFIIPIFSVLFFHIFV